jgi:hypothetical protein
VNDMTPSEKGYKVEDVITMLRLMHVLMAHLGAKHVECPGCVALIDEFGLLDRMAKR